MDGNLTLATAILLGFWGGRNTQISDLGGEVSIDAHKLLGGWTDSDRINCLLAVAVGFSIFLILDLLSSNPVEALLGPIFFLLADLTGAFTIRFAAERYSPLAETDNPLMLPEYKTPVSLFDYEKDICRQVKSVNE